MTKNDKKSRDTATLIPTGPLKLPFLLTVHLYSVHILECAIFHQGLNKEAAYTV